MSGSAPTMHWTVCASDAEWLQVLAESAAGGAADSCRPVAARPTSRRARRLAPLLLALLLAASVWGWRAGGHLLRQDEAGLQTALQLEQWAVTHDDARVARLALDPETIADARPYAAEFAALVNAAPAGTAPLTTTIHLLDVRGDQAVVQVRLTPAAEPGLRQTRFYRRVGASWLRTRPDPTLWGRPRTLTTAQFSWRYRQQDAAVIAAVAQRADALAATIAHTYGRPLTPAAPLTVTVSVDAAPRVNPEAAAIVLASPAVYLAPDNVADADLLLQALAIQLIRRAGAQARYGAAQPADWEPLVAALGLWQLWQLDLPLAQWEQPVVRWIYVVSPLDDALARDVFAAALCAGHVLWVEPAALQLPLLCDPKPVAAYAVQRKIPPPATLTELLQSGGDQLPSGCAGYDPPGRVVALTVLVDYLVSRYGVERLPDLLAALDQHAAWDDLLAAVYGATTAEVQAGWCAHLYGVYGARCDRYRMTR